MTRNDATSIVSRLFAATREISDPSEQIKVGTKVFRELINEYLKISDTEEAEIIKLREQVEDLNTQIFHVERGLDRRVLRNVELIRENHELRQKRPNPEG